MRRALAIASSSVLLAGCGGGGGQGSSPVAAIATPATPTPSPPPVDARLPRDPEAVAAALAADLTALRRVAGAWDGSVRPPRELTLLALHEQRLEHLLVDRPGLRRATLRRLRGDARLDVRDGVRAEVDLAVLSRGWPLDRRLRTARPAPAADLRRFYRRAQRRFGVSPTLLAAVNLVESAFGRLRNDSVAGARGPMQFMPATWRAYGLGGDVHDPRDAILGAAHYLRRSGAPGDEAAALLHYNPSPRYVSAVLRYARRMRRDRSAFRALYAREVFVRAAGGRRRITGPRQARRRVSPR
jgi:soluble lytic murein transglycosylase-like protein